MSFAPLLVAADPDPFNLQLLEEACGGVGVEVVTAIDGIQALEIIARQPPTIVLVAADLDGHDGFAIQKILKDDPELRTLSVIVAVPDAEAALRAETFKIAHVHRPYQVVEVQQAVGRALRAARDRRRKQRERRPVTADLDAITGAGSRGQLLLTLDYERTRAERFRWPLSVAVVRIAPANAGTLAAVSHGLRSTLRSVDLLFRSGPNELAAVLPETDIDGAEVALERVREKLRDDTFWHGTALRAEIHLAAAALQPHTKDGQDMLVTARKELR